MRKAVPVLLVLFTVACENSGVVSPRSNYIPQRSVTSTNDHFFFLPPLATTPTPNGEFNAEFSPVVEVCHVESAACPLVVRFSYTEGPQHVVLDEANENYHVTWNTTTNPVPNGVYRISVLSARSDEKHTLLGSVDLNLGVNPFAFPSRPNGQPVLIAFRVEKGALCSADECVETSVDTDGGEFTRPDSLAGAYFPPGAIPGDAGTVNFVIERFTDHSQACLPTDFPQYEGCYRFRTEPHVTFDELVTVGICLDPAAQPIEDQLVLQKWDEVNPSSLVTLPRVSVDFLDCGNFQVSQAAQRSSSRLAQATRSLLSPLFRWFGPNPVLAAVISPYGGRLSDFSRIGWVRPLAVTGIEPAVISPAGSQYRAVVTSAITGAPVAGVPVSWFASAPSNAIPTSGTTDANGVHGTYWVLNPPGGERTLTAQLSNPRPSWPGRPGTWGSYTFTKTVPEPTYVARFLSPLTTTTMGSQWWSSAYSPTVTVCRLNGTACAATVATFEDVPANVAARAYEVTWNVPSTLTRTNYRFTVTSGTQTLGTFTAAAVTTKTKTAQFEVGKPLAIRFSIEP